LGGGVWFWENGSRAGLKLAVNLVIAFIPAAVLGKRG